MVLTPTIGEKSYNRQDWQKGYQSQPNEYDYEVEDIEGQIPPDLQGTVFKNGPGLLDIAGTAIAHPFDGDGMISAISFNQGRVHYRNRFVKTEGYLREQKAGKPLYRGVFGTKKPGGIFGNAFDLRLKNIANTNVIYWGNKLLALWEAAEPHRLDAKTLDTIGLDYLDGILERGDAFAAHPRIDPACIFDNHQPCLVNFAIKTGLSSAITLYEISPTGKLLRRHTHSIPGFCFIHDFVITPHYAIFFQNPVGYNPFPFLFGLKGAGECVINQPDKLTRIIIIPRDPNKGEVKVLETPSGFVFHHSNAFEQLAPSYVEGGEKIYIDSICYQSLPQLDSNSNFQSVDFDSLAPGHLWRFTLNLSENTVTRECILEHCCEFPSINPAKVGRDYRYLYIAATHHATGNAPLQAILKLDLLTGEKQLHSFAPRGFAGEPIFVPKPDGIAEDDGWLLVVTYDAANHRSNVVILDAKDITNSLAVIHLKHHIPYGLHGSWTRQCF
ncbi:carotenoid oxygenase family protein [Microcystis aeruginosa]|uniref:Apocarotenoid-15,15'-oxygenase n=1 Tax=Microcystis aeruginosa Ma_QC_C_20070703_M131 TaxID=2486263 RepID=A0A551X4V1_MICAE|nr:carotenoid oxygenase family protein [Microcystis aeruginosa]MDB9393179.1 carotenoid oxygenase family protein [Microcystis aeruginosa CS-579]TRT43748.1 MAG: Apocarotenoid-15,15'-oxygenase [Microcystis aeruginosa Ma_QC_C_20070703_M131]